MARKYEEPKAKATNDAYTGMLGLSLIALLIGCGVLYLDYAQYPNSLPGKLDISKAQTRPERDPGEVREQPKAPPSAAPDENKEPAKDESPDVKKG